MAKRKYGKRKKKRQTQFLTICKKLYLLQKYVHNRFNETNYGYKKKKDEEEEKVKR